jgi:hypothetical protein
MIEFLDVKNRQEALIVCAGVALHGMVSNPSYAQSGAALMVTAAFDIAREFLRQAEAVKP